MYRLLAPDEYWTLTQEQRDKFRCGPGEGVLEGLVPNVWRLGWPLYTVLVVTPACSIHDFQYRYWAPPTEAGRAAADLQLRKNLFRLIANAGGPKWLRKARYTRACEYWWMVRKCGYQAFWGDRVMRMRGVA